MMALDPPSPKNLPLVIGVGNAYRRDDSVGLHIAREVRTIAPGDALVLERSGEGVDLMDCWREADRVILVDAVRSGKSPGAIIELNASATPIPSDYFHYSTHAFSIAEAVEMCRALDMLPASIHIIGVEGADFGSGTSMSPAVADAVAPAALRIVRLLHESSESPADPTCLAEASDA